MLLRFLLGPLGAAVLSDIRRVEAVPWHIWDLHNCHCLHHLGVYWDISWHITIGRDTSWTPAHLLIQFGAILAASSSAYLIFRTTFVGNVPAKDCADEVFMEPPSDAFWSASTPSRKYGNGNSALNALYWHRPGARRGGDPPNAPRCCDR